MRPKHAMEGVIDLRSDTLSRFTRDDLDHIDLARVGDSGFDEDPYVTELEVYCARMFAKEAAIFMPSGTMSNQVALRVLAAMGDEVITAAGYHINFFESSQVAACSGIVLNPLRPADGILRRQDIEQAIDEKARWGPVYAEPRVVAVENSINAHGGTVFPFDELVDISRLCRERGLSLFIDGARLLNACAATGLQPDAYAAQCDMVTLCFAKGLGAPFGSMLMGSAHHVRDARKFRKWHGGAMHQAGLMAAIALKRLAGWRDRLAADNDNARVLSRLLDPSWTQPYEAQTNMVFLTVPDASRLASELMEAGVLSLAWTSTQLRFVTSNLVDGDSIRRAASIINRFAARGLGKASTG